MTMEKDVEKLVEGSENYTGSNLRVQKNIIAPVTTLSKSDLDEPDNINKYRSFVGQLVWYTAKVGPDVANVERGFLVHMSNPGTEHWKSLGRLVVYLKGKETKDIIIINPKVLKAVMFCDSNYATDNVTRNSASGLVATLGGVLLTCPSKTQSTVILSSM